MTASAWTPTPVPTATFTLTPSPTPIPYDLKVMVTDSEGNPLTWASVIFPESGNDRPVRVDDSGQVSWSNLELPAGMLAVSAPGYFEAEQSVKLERGQNEVIVQLERDPNGVSASEACAPGEKPLYLEDFQDGRAQEMQAVEFQTGGWSIGISPDVPENAVLTLNLPDSYGGVVTEIDQASPANVVVQNTVLRYRLFVNGAGTYRLSWQMQNDPYETSQGHADSSRYFILIGTTAGGRGPRTSALVRLQPPLADFVVVDRAVQFLTQNQWHFIEVGSFEGVISVWLDGDEIINYADPQALPAGTFGFGADELASDAIAYYDNISVCELSAPFATMFAQ